MNITRNWIWAIIVTVLLPLVACGSDDGDSKKDDEKKAAHKVEIKNVPPICPQVGVIHELDAIRTTADGSNDPLQLVFGAKLLGVEGDCAYPDEGNIDVSFHLNMIAKRGPKADGRHAHFPVFVAVVDPDGNIRNKQIFNEDVSFSSDETFANHDDAMHVLIPLPHDQIKNGPYYRVLSGFQLSADQAAAQLPQALSHSHE